MAKLSDAEKAKDAKDDAKADEILANFKKITEEADKETEDEEAVKNLNDILKTAGAANAKLEKINKILAREN
jgi:hypothetical protein